jgi:hypothetical protein
VAVVDEVGEQLERAVPDFSGRRGDWAGVLAAAGADERDRRRWSRRAVAVVPPAAAVGALALAALFVSTPWTTSPGFLERAQAALTPPSGTIFHYRSEATMTSTDPACTVRRGPNEFWIDQTPPHRFRALLNDLPDPGADPRALVCSTGIPGEVGGTLGDPPEQTLVFEPPNTLRGSRMKFLMPQPDPLSQLRQAISDGSAHHEGKAQVEGRTVERIRIDPASTCPFPDCPPGPTYVYVDPETFYPVEVRAPAAVGLVNGPVLWHDIVVRYDTYEFLPRTDANLALTDIRAQHPDATGP